MRQTIMNKEDLLENIAQHVCPDCEGHGSVRTQGEYLAEYSRDERLTDCVCDNGFIE